MKPRFFLSTSFTGALMINDRRPRFTSFRSEIVYARPNIAQKACIVSSEEEATLCLDDIIGDAEAREKRLRELRRRRTLQRQRDEYYLRYLD